MPASITTGNRTEIFQVSDPIVVFIKPSGIIAQNFHAAWQCASYPLCLAGSRFANRMSMICFRLPVCIRSEFYFFQVFMQVISAPD
jgi:hypothetical protein